MRKFIRFMYCVFTAFFILGMVFDFLIGIKYHDPYYISKSTWFLIMSILGWSNAYNAKKEEEKRDKITKET